MVDAGKIQPEDIYTNKLRNLITRAVGKDDTLSADVFEVVFGREDTLVLCCDGVWEGFPPERNQKRERVHEKIRKVIAEKIYPSTIAEALTAKEVGDVSKDNTSAIVIQQSW